MVTETVASLNVIVFPLQHECHLKWAFLQHTQNPDELMESSCRIPMPSSPNWGKGTQLFVDLTFSLGHNRLQLRETSFFAFGALFKSDPAI